jgi:hypothetical protein
MNGLALEGQLGIPFASADAIAERLARYLESIAALDPLYRSWMPSDTRRHRSAVPAILTWPPDQAELRTWINESAAFESRKGRKQRVGYRMRALTPEDDPIRVDFWLTIDFTDSSWWFLNRVGITFFVARGNIWVELHRGGQNPIALARRALLDLGTTWDCDWAAACRGDFRWGGGGRPSNAPLPRYRSGWMVYLDQVRAAHVKDVGDIHVDKLPNGGALFTSTSDAIFDVGKANHWAAALRLQEALSPLNDPGPEAGK